MADTTISTLFAKVAVLLCLVWAVSFPLFGGSSWGMNLFASWASHSFLNDSKAGVPILMLTFPILLAGSIATLFTTVSITTSPPTVAAVMSVPSSSFWPCLRRRSNNSQPSWCFPCWVFDCAYHPWTLLILIIVIPSNVYLLSVLQRHLNYTGLTTDDKLMEIGNSFGMLSVVALSCLLIPATQSTGPLSKLFRWDPIRAVQVFHVWTGRIVVVCGIVHGLFHCIRLGLQSRQILLSYLFPPLDCWRHPQKYNPPICELADGTEGCSCYDHFLFFTGIVAGVVLVLIGLSSLHNARRRFFSSFARIHYVSTPLAFVMICIHYNRAILYASGSLLYYLASSYPVWIECVWRRLRRQSISIATIERIEADPCQPHRPCLALTLEASQAAIHQYWPGFFGRLSVPALSTTSHPFTINIVPNHPHRIRIIVRVSGSFTRTLERTLCDCDHEEELPSSTESAPSPLPDIYLDGYCGSGNLIDRIANHDVCVLVAAGVGITPYLSLFAVAIGNRDRDDGLVKQDQQRSSPAKKVMLHWICRDEALIQYCRREYMDPFFKCCSGDILFQVNIYHTGRGRGSFIEDSSNSVTRVRKVDVSNVNGIPFELSSYNLERGFCKNIVKAIFFALLAWGGLLIIWNWYQRQEPEAFAGRCRTLIVLMVYGLATSLLGNFVLYFLKSKYLDRGWAPLSTKDSSIREENDNDNELGVEMASFNNDTKSPATTLQKDLGSLENDQCLRIDLYEQRPNLEKVVSSLSEGKAPAMFCCVTPSLARSLKDTVGNSNWSCRSSPIAIYQESFEI